MKTILQRWFVNWRGMAVPSIALIMLGVVGVQCDDDVCNPADPYRCDGDSLLTCTEGAYTEGAALVLSLIHI